MKNFIFDFDGTLADSGKTGVLATQTAFKKFCLDIPSEETINYFMGVPIEVSFKKMASKYVFEKQEFQELLTCFRDFYKQFEADNLKLFPDMREVLKSLKEKNKALFVVSSKHSTALLRNLSDFEVDKYFQDIVGSDQVTHFKPDPEGLLTLIDKFNLDVNNSVMIGDAIFDLQMGKSAGIKTCGVVWGAHNTETLRQENPNYLLHQPVELLNI